MKDLAIMVIGILAIVAVANTKQIDMQPGFGGMQVVNLAERDFLGDDLQTYEFASGLEDGHEDSIHEETTAYADNPDVYEVIDEGSLRTAVLK